MKKRGVVVCVCFVFVLLCVCVYSNMSQSLLMIIYKNYEKRTWNETDREMRICEKRRGKPKITHENQ